MLCVLLIINDTWLLCLFDTKIMERLIHFYPWCLMGNSELDKKKDKRCQQTFREKRYIITATGTV